jgi:hypothetical protein
MAETRYTPPVTIIKLLRSNKPAADQTNPCPRLVLSCRFPAMLLATIPKSEGIPACVRAGSAGYLAWPDRSGVDPPQGLAERHTVIGTDDLAKSTCRRGRSGVTTTLTRFGFRARRLKSSPPPLWARVT